MTKQTNKGEEWIDEKIVDIMIEDGPDGHCDGHHIITDFIMALLNGTEDQWWIEYEKRVEQQRKDHEEFCKNFGKNQTK